MDELDLRAKIEAELRAEIEAELRGKAVLDQSLRNARASAGQLGNGDSVRQDYGGKPSDNARIYGAVLAAQMLGGLPGTGLADDGQGDGTGSDA